MNDEVKADAAKLLPLILDYCRMSIVLILQLAVGSPKEQLLNQLDNALLERTSEERLATRLKQACQV